MIRSTAQQELSHDDDIASSSGPPEPAGRGDSPSTGTATKRRSRVARDSEPVAFGGTTGMREKENACEGADAPVLTTCGFGADLSALPDELLVHVLASLSGLRLRAVLTSWVNDPTAPGAHPSGHCDLFGRTIGHALAAAGACCKAFAFHVREAATIIADRHRWRLPLVGSAPKHLSKLEQDTKRVQFPIRDGSVCMRWMGKQLGEFLHLWTTEVSPGFIGPLLIDPQVRRHCNLEFGEFLIRFSMRFDPDHPNHDFRMAWVFQALFLLMAQPGTQLNSSWLAARVLPLVKEHWMDKTRTQKTTWLHLLLYYIDPHVLRSHGEIFEWLKMSLQKMRARVFTGPALNGANGWVYTNESRWAAGLRAWNARYTAQGLDLEDCNIARDAKLKAIVGYGQAGGCFARLPGPPLSEQDPPAEFWWRRAGCDYFHAIYHNAPRH